MDIEQMAASDERAMERIASALEAIAEAMTMGYKLDAQRFEKEYPVKPDVRDATVTRIPSSLDALKEDQGATEETTDEWVDIGPTEQRVIDAQRAKTSAPVRKSRVNPKAGGS